MAQRVPVDVAAMAAVAERAGAAVAEGEPDHAGGRPVSG